MGAGYPPASKLLPTIRAAAENTPFPDLRRNAADWDRVVGEAERLGLPRQLIDNPNPEIPLSLLDLWDQAQQEAGPNFLRLAATGAPTDEADLHAWFDDRVRAITSARRALHKLLVHYFAQGTSEDYTSRRTKRHYLRSILDPLVRGDIVITLNWDTLVEMTLAEAGKWFASDGYGFRNRFRPVRGTLPAGVRSSALRSKIKVLKLHGGVGWKIRPYEADRVYLSPAHLLQHLPTTVRGTRVFFRDVAPDGEAIEALDDLLEIPSYLKQISRNPEMAAIWRQAASALARATEVEIWGYGLPDSDGEVHLLLTGLRPRLERGKVRVTVHNPDGGARERWRQLLGPRATIDRAKL